MNRFLTRLFAALCFCAGAISPAWADDIDIFAYNSSTTPTATANVLLVIDNAASANSSADFRCGIDSAGNVYTTAATVTNANKTDFDQETFGATQCALYEALKSLSVSTAGSILNVGVMMFNSNGLMSYNPQTDTYTDNCRISNASDGGCLVIPMSNFSGTNRTRILNWIRGWVGSGNSNLNVIGSGLANGATMQEAWAYFTGRVGLSGRNYSSIKPSAGTTCSTSNYVIFLGNAFGKNVSPSDQTGSKGPKDALSGSNSTALINASPAATALELALMNDSITSSCGTANLPTGNNAENLGAYALNWARYMKNQAGIKTYSIGLLGSDCNRDYAAHLTKLGAEDVGGGKFFGTNDFSTLNLALKTVLSEILAVDTVFASVSLPVSTATQGEYLNQIFVGMFRPDGDFLPRWRGNLKQYKLGNNATQTGLEAKDADDRPAINSNTGFLASCARSFWTPSSTDTYWANDPRGSCQGVTAESSAQLLKGSNYPDGEVVEKGGQAYRLRTNTSTSPPTPRQITGTAGRNVLTGTCNSTGGSCSLENFVTTLPDSGAYARSLFGAADKTARDALISWARGENNKDNELSLGTGVARASIHGDVVHSRPVAINHGSDDSAAGRRVVVYYGANDGLLRAIQGNPTGSTNYGGSVSYAAGDELWSFMPPEFFGGIKRQYDNTAAGAIFYPNTPNSAATARTWGMDGPVSSYFSANRSTTYVYATMRRGGRAMYGFSVGTRPDSPSLLWRQGCSTNLSGAANTTSTSASDCTTGFSDIGQTWGALVPISVPAFVNPLLIMAGGYETCEDTETGSSNHSCDGVAASSRRGRAIFVLDATTGAVVRRFDTTRAVVADPAIITDSAGRAVYAYTADLGGNVYRICFVLNCGNGPTETNSTRNHWTITRIASVGCNSSTTVSYTAPSDAANAASTSTAGGGYGPATSPCAAPRKFMYRPSVVTSDNNTYYVFLGSGDREKPVAFYSVTHGVSNYFFQIKDQPRTSGWLTNACPSGTTKDVICLTDSLNQITTAAVPSSSDLASKKGWALALSAGTAAEQVVTSAVTAFGVTTFSTNTPQTSSCGPSLGLTKVYSVNYLDASPVSGATGTPATSRFETVTGGGLPPSPVAGRVKLDDGTVAPFCIGCSSTSPLAGAKPKELTVVRQPKRRLYWYLAK
jgi:type IV pilus assembly protein PilY1